LTTTGSPRRVESIDVLRGVIMIVMALDHTRDFFGVAGINPTDPARTTIALFFTRWITHFCAPVFFLLTGTGAFLSIGRRTRGELSWLLFTRGVWLIVLELTFVRCFGYQFNVDYRVTMLVVLWALGWAMIVLAALVHLPPIAVGGIGASIIATHNLFDSVRAASLGAFAPLWTVLHAQNVVLATPRITVFVAYPLIPWIGVTAVGYGLGALYRQPAARRRSTLLRLGRATTAAFVVLRVMNAYGDPFRWRAQRSAVFTALSFLNATKYPPSLLFLLMTLGPSLLALWMLDRGTPRILRIALVYGQVPLFYFVLHLTLIHLLAVVVCELRYGERIGCSSRRHSLAIRSRSRPAGDSRCRSCMSRGCRSWRCSTRRARGTPQSNHVGGRGG
jgi:Predicted membrane protein